MLMPSIITKNLFDDFFEPKYYTYNHSQGLMKTDVRETETGYELSVDLPGVKKDDLQVELKDGYMTINASKNHNLDEKDDGGRYIRRERYSGTFSRSFYVGENVTEDEIKARFEDGTLKLKVPKKDNTPQVEEKKYIAIEG